MNYTNPELGIEVGDFLSLKTPRYEAMMTLLFEDAVRAQSIYYCGKHQSIETVSTHKLHKMNCETFTRGMILGNVIFLYSNSFRKRQG